MKFHREKNTLISEIKMRRLRFQCGQKKMGLGIKVVFWSMTRDSSQNCLQMNCQNTGWKGRREEEQEWSLRTACREDQGKASEWEEENQSKTGLMTLLKIFKRVFFSLFVRIFLWFSFVYANVCSPALDIRVFAWGYSSAVCRKAKSTKICIRSFMSSGIF